MAAPVQNVGDALGRYPWHDDAKCKGEDSRLFFPSARTERGGPELPSILLPMLVCAECPVRRECLEEALRRRRVVVRGDKETIVYQAVGIWGGSTGPERALVADETVTVGADLLEATFEKRLAIRVAAFRERYGDRLPGTGGRGGAMWTAASNRQLSALLDARAESLTEAGASGP